MIIMTLTPKNICIFYILRLIYKFLFINIYQLTYIMMQQEPNNNQHASRPPKTIKRPEKITQIQCSQINNQLSSIFIQSLNDGFKYLPNVLSKIYLQLELFINFVEYRLTIAVGQPHPGDFLQNITYSQKGFTQTKKLLYLLLTVILPYLKQRIHNYVLDSTEGWKGNLSKILTLTDKILSILNFINSAIFLYKGKFRCLVQRLLSIQMQFINPDNSRILNFSLMNRRLIWQIYELFLKTMLPYIHNYFTQALKNIFYLDSYLGVDEIVSSCIICHSNLVMPMKASPCSHMGCYYCVMSEIKAESKENKCKMCGELVKQWEKCF